MRADADPGFYNAAPPDQWQGSFFRGDGKGSAAAPRFALTVATDATLEAVREIALAARADGDRAVIEVADRGPGIPDAVVVQLFRPFFTTSEHGTGLGLYIVARLTQILGHTIQLASRPGRGTRFKLLLEPTDPLQAAERAAAAQLGNSP